MLRFSKKVEYALIALTDMSAKPAGELTTARALADKFDISPELMGKLLQILHKNQFITSVQGPKGGYYLTKSPDEINLGMVIEAIDGKIRFADCDDNCLRMEKCKILEPMQCIQQDMVSYFSGISLKDFLRKHPY